MKVNLRTFCRNVFLAFTAAFGLLSCNPDPVPISLSRTALNFDPAGGTQVLYVNAPDAWQIELISGSLQWIDFSTLSGGSGRTEVRVTVGAMPGANARTATFRANCASSSKIFTVSQYSNVPADAYVMVQTLRPDGSRENDPIADGHLETIYAGQEETYRYAVSVSGSTIFSGTAPWFYQLTPSSSSWLHVNTSGTYDERGYYDPYVTITHDPITTCKGRETTVTFTAGVGSTISIKYVQNGLMEEGRRLSNITVTDATGSYSLQEAMTSHQYAILYLFGSWCSDCQAFLPYLKDIYDHFNYYNDKEGTFKFPGNLAIFGIGLEKEGEEQAYYEYMEEAGLNDYLVDPATGAPGEQKRWWESRAIFSNPATPKVNEVTQLLYGDDIDSYNYIPTVIVLERFGELARIRNVFNGHDAKYNHYGFNPRLMANDIKGCLAPLEECTGC